jgi:pyridoxal phosphate enzyme (YggS family)
VALTAESVAARAEEVRSHIAGAGGDPARVRVVAVTKGFGPEAVAAARQAGLHDLGENYAQELVSKAEAVAVAAPSAGLGPEPLRWHFLGTVQRNKVRRLAPLVALWHAVDRLDAGEAIARHAPGAAVLVEVSLTGEAHRGGCREDQVAALTAALGDLGLDVRGLMAIGPPGPPEAARAGFRRLAALAADLGLPELSMGMTDDLEIAVQEGATIVRVGRALFGPRPVRRDLRRLGSERGGV